MKPKNPLFWIVAIIGLLLDHVTKQWALQTLVDQSMTIIPGVLNFTFAINEGAAFGAFKDNGGWLKWLSLVISIGLFLYGWLVRLPNRWEAAGYGFILSGALGNGIERLLKGHVVDFLSVFPSINLPFFNHPFPIFNVADICINLGILCLLIVAIKEEPAVKTTQSAESPEGVPPRESQAQDFRLRSQSRPSQSRRSWFRRGQLSAKRIKRSRLR
ncbi:MAG: signal peptidase II [Cyanobacteria bacterium J06581_3]